MAEQRLKHAGYLTPRQTPDKLLFWQMNLRLYNLP